MKEFKKRGALTHFQILSEICKQNPNLKQKDLAKTLDITIQAVSENIKVLIEEGYITSKDGRSPYKITQKGIDKVKKDAIVLRKYSDSVLETMNHFKTVWPAITAEKLKEGESVGIYMNQGILYASKKPANATGTVLKDTEKGRDVPLGGLSGLIDMKIGEAVIITLPNIKNGGSEACNLELIKNIYEEGTNHGGQIDKVAIVGTVSRSICNQLDIPIDIEFGTAAATANACRKGLNVMVLSVGDMTKAFIRELEEEKVKFNIIDGMK